MIAARSSTISTTASEPELVRLQGLTCSGSVVEARGARIDVLRPGCLGLRLPWSPTALVSDVLRPDCLGLRRSQARLPRSPAASDPTRPPLLAGWFAAPWLYIACSKINKCTFGLNYDIRARPFILYAGLKIYFQLFAKSALRLCTSSS